MKHKNNLPDSDDRIALVFLIIVLGIMMALRTVLNSQGIYG